MSDTLLAFAQRAFDHSDWTTLLKCLRQYLEQLPASSAIASSSRETGDSASRASVSTLERSRTQQEHPSLAPPEAEAYIHLATQALPLVDFQTRWSLVSLISGFGPAAITSLVRLLDTFEPDEDDDTDWDLLWFMARVLGNIRHPHAVDALVRVLQTSPSEDVVTAVIMALAQQGSAAIAPLTLLLKHASTKQLAVQGLAQLFISELDPALKDVLITIIDDPDPAVRMVAVEALSHSHHPMIADILVAISDDLSAKVRRAAVLGLGLQAKTMAPDQLIAALKPRLWDLDMEVCRQAAIALGRTQAVEATDVLATALESGEFPPSLKLDVVRALIWSNTQAGLDHLARYLTAHRIKAEIYQEIVVMLGRVEAPALQPQANQLLLSLLEEHSVPRQSEMIRQSIATSLGQLKQGESAPALTHLANDTDHRVRLHAIAALKNLAANPTANPE